MAVTGVTKMFVAALVKFSMRNSGHLDEYSSRHSLGGCVKNSGPNQSHGWCCDNYDLESTVSTRRT